MTDERPRIAKTTEQKRAGAPPHTAHAADVRTNGGAPAIPQPRPIPPLPSLPARVANAAGVASGHGHSGETARDTGIAPGTVSPTGTGQDARHRGWYWHWNTLITQYAPILGLKGVGLLNSYTVWTDRREGSPHQGYAFPAQESEARFYGEGREELITLNKVLVALDLMEIHKEMVVRQDDRGRRWRVPHNFYRVKDPKEGLVLSLPAVVRVLELAQRDRNVFRQVRHIFGPQFTPIDRTSLWHSLLPELRALPLWIELEARATRERRTPRTATVATLTDASTAATDAAKQRSHGTTIVASHDIDSPFPWPTDDNASERETLLPSTIDMIADNDSMPQTTASESDTALPFLHPPTDKALRPTMVSRPIMEPSRLTIGSIHDEGMMNVEYGDDGSVTPADSMYYQSGETKEETTSTSSTFSRTRVHEGRPDAKTRTPETHLTHLASPPAPLRASVSDLFTALEAQRTYEPTDDTDADTALPPSANEWELLTNAVAASVPIPVPADVLPDAQGSVQPGTTPRASLGQPLPPEPGEPEEGLIVVRAVAVTDQPAIGTDERALLAAIESALTMTNGRSPSDMEMSLYWQIARDADAAARNQPGPGSGLGWVLTAITEAVYSSGTGRVAPKYVARICERWTVDGYMSDGRIAPASGTPAPPPQWPLTAVSSPATPDHPDHLDHATATGDASPTSPPTPAADMVLTDADLARLWPAVGRRLEGILPTDSLQARWFTEARVLSVTGDRATVQAINAETALKLTNYRGLISRRLSDVLGRPIEVVFQAAPTRPPNPDTSVSDTATETDTDTDMALDISPEVLSSSPQMSTQVHTIAPPETVAVSPPSPWSWPASSGALSSPMLPAEVAPRSSTTMGSGPIAIVSPLTYGEARLATSASASTLPKPARVVSRKQPLEAASAPALLSVLSSSIPTFAVAGSEETNREIWPRVLMRLRERMTDVTFKVWMEPTALIAVDADGMLVVGARNRVQRERLERQHATDIAAALGALLGCTVCVRIAVIGE